MAQATVLNPRQYRYLLRVTEAISRDPARDILVLLLGHPCGHARVRDCLNRGRRRAVSVWGDPARGIPRAAITKGGR